jgi:hypothetical protein
MHVEVTRMVTAWLGHAVYGVNALLPNVSRDLIGGEEEDEEPELVTIYNDIDFELDDVAGFNPAKRPALAVICDVNPEGTDISQPDKPGHEYGLTGAIAYYAKEGTPRARARRDGNYVLRAAGQSLARFNRPQLSKDFRQLNDVLLARLTKLSFQRVAGAVPESSLMGIVFFEGILLNKAP